MWGIYIAKTRSEVETYDPAGHSLLRDFLPEFIHTPFVLHPGFSGAFDMTTLKRRTRNDHRIFNI